jgi:hypothetical protein
MEQNYFQYNDQYFKPEKGIAMGSPISGTTAEIYLQSIENEYIKNGLIAKKSVTINGMWMTLSSYTTKTKHKKNKFYITSTE